MIIVSIQGRQAHYGVPGDGLYLTLLESHNEASLSWESGQQVATEPVRVLPDDATAEQVFDALAELEFWGETWAEQCARIRRAWPDEDEDTYPPAHLTEFPRNPLA